jgi:hypothetical protein
LCARSTDDLSTLEGPAAAGNFWDVGNYRVVLKRINTGAKLCDEFVRLIHERCENRSVSKFRVFVRLVDAQGRLVESFRFASWHTVAGNVRSRSLVSQPHRRAAIEKQYAKQLMGWTERWEARLRTIGEFGTLKDGWQSVLSEARGLADIHTGMKVHTAVRARGTKAWLFVCVCECVCVCGLVGVG